MTKLGLILRKAALGGRVILLRRRVVGNARARANLENAMEQCAETDHVLARPFLEALTTGFKSAPHRIRVDCDPALDISDAEVAAIRTVVNEALSNALQHAYPNGRAGQIWVRLAQEDERVKLTVRDDGIGIPDLPSKPTGGRRLIDDVARQLDGYARVGSAPFGGALVSLVYPRPI